MLSFFIVAAIVIVIVIVFVVVVVFVNSCSSCKESLGDVDIWPLAAQEPFLSKRRFCQL